MPVYTFKCEICGAVFEERCHMNHDMSGLMCPNNHAKIHQVYSSPYVIYKGPGFYVNDCRSKTPKVQHDRNT
jgi:putative FmdB family regulatory protein